MALLERIAQELDISLPSDCGEPELAAPTDIREVVSTLDSVLPGDSCGADPQTQEGSTDDDPARDPRTDLERPVRARPDNGVGGA